MLIFLAKGFVNMGSCVAVKCLHALVLIMDTLKSRYEQPHGIPILNF